jgi:5-methylcytosine-specific restriction endonuclease McrA
MVSCNHVKRCGRCGEEKPVDEFFYRRCWPCVRLAKRERYAADPEKHLDMCRRWRAANIERMRERDHRRAPQVERARARDYYRRNAEARRAYAARRREEWPENTREAQRRHRQAHPERHAAHEQTRRARLLAVFVEPVDHLSVYERDGWTCQLCHKLMTPATASLDHIIPLAVGGEHSYSNVQAAHRRCNARKQDRLEMPHAHEHTGGAA